MGEGFAHIRGLSHVGSIGELLFKFQGLHAWTGMASGSDTVLLALCWLQSVLSLIPYGWVQAASVAQAKVIAGVIPRPVLEDALAILLPRLGWRLLRGGLAPRLILMVSLSVRDATLLQLIESQGRRTRAHESFIREAHERGEDVATTATELSTLIKLFSVCWALEWENKQKEIFWRLSVDGVADGHRWVGIGSQACTCGAQSPRRGHFFWACEVARAVVKEMEKFCPDRIPLRQANLWLMQPPVGAPEKDGW